MIKGYCAFGVRADVGPEELQKNLTARAVVLQEPQPSQRPGMADPLLNQTCQQRGSSPPHLPALQAAASPAVQEAGTYSCSNRDCSVEVLLPYFLGFHSLR